MKTIYKYILLGVFLFAFSSVSQIFAQDEQEQKEQQQKQKLFLIQTEKPFTDKFADYC